MPRDYFTEEIEKKEKDYFSEEVGTATKDFFAEEIKQDYFAKEVEPATKPAIDFKPEKPAEKMPLTKGKFDIRTFFPMQYPHHFGEQYFPAEEKAIQALQKRIEPKEETLAKAKRPILTEFPKFVASEALSMYKPSRIATAQAIGPALGLAGKAVTKVTPAPVKRLLGKAFKYRYGQPPAYQTAAEKAALKRVLGAEEATTVSKILSTTKAGKPLTPSQQKYVGRLFRGEVAVTPRLLAKPKFQEYQTIAKEGRTIMDRWSDELVKSGIPSKHATRVIEENIGRYMPRMFKPRLLEKGLGFPRKPLRLKLAGLKHRKDLSASVLKKLGEIKEPALPTAIRVRELATTSANAELFNTVAKNPAWTANVNITGRMVKMPLTPSMGALKGKWVIPNIADDINGIVLARSQAIKIYDKALSAWKFGKVVLNPATHARNIMSNTMLLDMSGINHFRQAQLLPSVIKDYVKKGKMYREAKSGGLLGTEFYSVEASQFLNSYNLTVGENHLSRIMNVLKVPFRKAGETYQFEEQLAKMIKFTSMRQKGAGIGQAVKEAEKWIFNYQKIPKFIEFMRRFGPPFVTFTYKALPRIAETAVNNPLKLYKYYAFANAFNNASAKQIGLTEEEMAQEKKYMPEWMKTKIPGMPTQLLMPTKDEYGRTQYLNLEYILPIGLAPEIAERGLMKGLITNPVLTAFTELKSNKDFRGKEIYSETDTAKERNFKMAEYLYRQAMPSFAPSLPGIKGGYSWEKLKASLEKRGDYLGRVRSPEQVMFDIFAGLKIQPVSVREGIRFESYQKRIDVQKALQKLRSTFRHRGIRREEKEKVKKETLEKIKRIQER
jgi:hypothetical protein